MAGGPAPLPPAQAIQSWTSGAKDLVMTASGHPGASRVWATTGQGIVTEIYWPAVDQPQVKDLGFLIGGPGWWQEVKRAGNYTLATPEPGLMLPAIVHTGSRQAYQLTLRPVVDPNHDTLLIDYELAGAGVRLYPLLAPHLGICQITPEAQWTELGADNQAWTDPADLALFASGSGGFLCLLARPGFTRAGVGYVGDTDGWTDFSRNQSMTLTYSQAGPGVIALTGELTAGSGLLALGFGDSQEAARAAAQASLDGGPHPARAGPAGRGGVSRATRAGRRAAGVGGGAADPRRPHRVRRLRGRPRDSVGGLHQRPRRLPHGVVPGRRGDRARARSGRAHRRRRDRARLPGRAAAPGRVVAPVLLRQPGARRLRPAGGGAAG